jgi:vacuolar-type H+-ATPase subunit H
MSTRDLLERWRPSATPGAPSAAGVPADRVAERSAELEVVLSLLEDVEAQVDQIEARAADEARARRLAAEGRARALVAEAHRRARAERSAAAAEANSAGQAAARTILDRAEAESRRITERATTNQPALVAEVLSRARDRIGAEVTGAAEATGAGAGAGAA